MTLYEVKLIRNTKAPASEQNVEQEFIAVDSDTIGPLIEHLDTDIRSSNVKIVAIGLACKITKHIQ